MKKLIPFLFSLLVLPALAQAPKGFSPMKDTAEDPAERVPPCVVSAEQAKGIPEMDARVAKLVAAPKGTTEYDLFCPKQG